MALLLPLIVLAAFLLLRQPQRRRAQAQKALVDSLQPGVRVATVAGVIGTLVGTEGDRAAIEIAPGVIVEFLVAAITRTIEDPDPSHDGGVDPLEQHVDDHLDDHLDDHHLDDHLEDHLDGHLEDHVDDASADDEAHDAAEQPAPRHEES